MVSLIADTPMPLGSMVINSISKLCRLGGSSMYALPNAPCLADLEDDSDEEGKVLLTGWNVCPASSLLLC